MAKQESIEKDGIITEVLPNSMFRVKLDSGHQVLAYTSGKMKKYKIKMIQGDKVKIEMSPYDLNRGRVVYRHK